MHSDDGIIDESPNGTHNNETDAIARAYGPGEPCEAPSEEAAAEVKKTLVCLTVVKSKLGGDQVLLVLHFAIPGERFKDEKKQDPMNETYLFLGGGSHESVCVVFLVSWGL